MKKIYLNLKRFDIPPAFGGVNRMAEMEGWAAEIVEGIQPGLESYARRAEFVAFFPELHLLGALEAKAGKGCLRIGCQGVSGLDTEPGGNFGALTSLRPAAAMAAAGVEAVLIGHCEERRELARILAAAGVSDARAVNMLLGQEVSRALERGLDVLYCIGEQEQEMDVWQEVLGEQLAQGLAGADRAGITIAYEPVWSIGPGKMPADREYITKVARFIKERTAGLPVVYGGGLKQDNAAMLATIEEIDGGLIALTRFQGDIGFYPQEYLEIVARYLEA